MEKGYYKIAVPEGHNAIISTNVIPKRSTSGRARDAQYVVNRLEPKNEVEGCEGISGGVSVETNGQTGGDGAWMPEALIRRIEPVDDEYRDCSQRWTIADAITIGHHEKGKGRLEDEVDVEVVINFEPVATAEEEDKYPDGQEIENEGPDLSFDGAQEIKGGNSFSDATEVKPGAYKDTIVPGEYRYYKIPVEYGQQPVFSYRTLERQDGKTGQLSPKLYSPFRQTLEFESTRPEATLAGSVVQYRNRHVSVSGDEQANAGYYYVGVGSPQGDEDKVMGVEQPFEIAFDAIGQKTDGPEWRPTEKDGPEPSDTPPDTGEKKDGEEKSDDTDTQAQDESDDDGLGTKGILMLVLGIGIVVLLAALAGIIALLRRR